MNRRFFLSLLGGGLALSKVLPGISKPPIPAAAIPTAPISKPLTAWFLNRELTDFSIELPDTYGCQASSEEGCFFGASAMVHSSGPDFSALPGLKSLSLIPAQAETIDVTSAYDPQPYRSMVAGMMGPHVLELEFFAGSGASLTVEIEVVGPMNVETQRMPPPLWRFSFSGYIRKYQLSGDEA